MNITDRVKSNPITFGMIIIVLCLLIYIFTQPSKSSTSSQTDTSSETSSKQSISNDVSIEIEQINDTGVMTDLNKHI